MENVTENKLIENSILSQEITKDSVENKYVLTKCENSRFSINISGNLFKILDRGKTISKGKIKIDKTENPNMFFLGKIEGAYYKDSIVIQNYGNSMNEYSHFTQCDEKYITFIKSKK